MILHFFPNEKFTIDYVRRVNGLFDHSENCFYIYLNKKKIVKPEDLKYDNVYFGEIVKDDETLKKWSGTCDRIVLHGMWFTVKEMRILLKYVKKIDTIWSVWGADFYNAYEKNHGSLNPYRAVKEYYRKSIVKHLYGVNSECDYEAVVNAYKTDAKQFFGQYTYKLIDVKEEVAHDEKIHVMVGHSATDTCRHIEVFEALKNLKGKIRVYCPLSYPKDEEYIAKVSEVGHSLFGDDYVAMRDFMKYDEYIDFLNTVDIGIFNNNRQQGNGNLINLVYLGKKVYASRMNTLYGLYEDLGVKLFDFEEYDENDFLTLLDEESKKRNIDLIRYRYSDENFSKTWRDVFYG